MSESKRKSVKFNINGVKYGSVGGFIHTTEEKMCINVFDITGADACGIDNTNNFYNVLHKQFCNAFRRKKKLHINMDNGVRCYSAKFLNLTFIKLYREYKDLFFDVIIFETKKFKFNVDYIKEIIQQDLSISSKIIYYLDEMKRNIPSFKCVYGYNIFSDMHIIKIKNYYNNIKYNKKYKEIEECLFSNFYADIEIQNQDLTLTDLDDYNINFDKIIYRNDE